MISAVFAADILSDVPGLSVVRSGAFGGVAQVRMRGAGPGKTLVLVDGVPVNDPAEVNGAFDFSGFELGDIERIEETLSVCEGVQEIGITVNAGGAPNWMAIKNQELFAQRVIPHFRAKDGKDGVTVAAQAS